MNDSLATEEVREFLLKEGLAEALCIEIERRGSSLYIPSLDTTLTPVVHKLRGTAVGIDFYLSSNAREKQFRDYCWGAGKDIIASVEMAVSMFSDCFMDGYQRICKNDVSDSFTTEFAGSEHCWNVAVSDLVGLGKRERSDTADSSVYWDALKDGLIRRLGNQKLAYVKVYAAKFPDQTIGEVRLDDVEIPELSAIVREMAGEWNAEQFASDKQFFFIAQDSKTIIPSPYDGEEGFRKMRSAVVQYLNLFKAADTQESYDRLYDDAVFLLGDETLAAECSSFLPEIAAVHMFGNKVTVSDKIEIRFEDGRTQEVYLSQLTDYAKIDVCLGDIISMGDLGEQTDALWNELVGYSSIYSAISNAVDAGSNIEDLMLTNTIYNVGRGFVIR